MKAPSCTCAPPFLAEHVEEHGNVICEISPAERATADKDQFAHLNDGFGRCGIDGCPCHEYVGQENNCLNCGHQYTDHWNN